MVLLLFILVCVTLVIAVWLTEMVSRQMQGESTNLMERVKDQLTQRNEHHHYTN